MHRLLISGLLVLTGFATVSVAQETREGAQATEQRLSDAENEIRALWRSYYGVVRDDLPSTKGSVDCSSARYEEVKATNSYLVFFVACERIEPYLNGYRATITIGNPHAFTFTRVSGTLSYGENVAAAIVRETQRAPFSTTSDLRPGTWISIQVPIVPADAKDLNKIIVEFEAAGAMGRSSEPPSRSTNVPQHGLLHP